MAVQSAVRVGTRGSATGAGVWARTKLPRAHMRSTEGRTVRPIMRVTLLRDDPQYQAPTNVARVGPYSHSKAAARVSMAR